MKTYDTMTREELEDLLKFYKDLYDFSPLSYASLDENGFIKEINWVGSAMLGIDREHLNEHPFSQHICERDIEKFNDTLEHCFRKGEKITVELELLIKDKGSINAQMLMVPVQDIDGRTLCRTAITDITDRKIAEVHNAKRLKLAHLGAEIGVALNQGASLQKMLQKCTETIVYYLEAAFARIWTFNKDEDMLELQASAGMYTHIDGEHSRIPVNSRYKLGFIALSREPHLTNNVIGDPQIINQEWAKMESMIAFAGYPLIVDNNLVGVMAMFSRRPFEDFALKALGSIANNVALGIKRKQADEELKKVFIELSDSLQHINTLSGMLPVCQSCRKIRDENGEWNELETYVKEKMESDLTPVLCPECEKTGNLINFKS